MLFEGGKTVRQSYDNVQLCGCDKEFVDVRRYINEMVGVDKRIYYFRNV